MGEAVAAAHGAGLQGRDCGKKACGTDTIRARRTIFTIGRAAKADPGIGTPRRRLWFTAIACGRRLFDQDEPALGDVDAVELGEEAHAEERPLEAPALADGRADVADLHAADADAVEHDGGDG